LGAKFNTDKTEIVLIGTPEFQLKMIANRKLNKNENAPIAKNIRIAKDREAVRMLGAWIGNNTDAATPWEPIIDKIHKSLNRYSKLHPTLNERKIIGSFKVATYFFAYPLYCQISYK